MIPPFQRFLDEHRDAVWRFAVASVGRQEADDVFQETFLAALRAYPRLRHRDNLRGWLLTIAHNKALDLHRARARRAVPIDPTATPEEPSSTLRGSDPLRVVEGSDDATTLEGSDPLRVVEGSDDGLWAAVHELPPKQRGAVLLRFVGDLSHREIAAALGSSEEAARRSLADGLAKLRKDWTPA